MPKPNSIQTISEFLLHAGTHYHILDLGRGVHNVESKSFLEMETGQLPIPFPRQQHGWFAIVFWTGKPVKHHYIWFVKLPVDERGLLVEASRHHFLQIITEALGQSLTADGEKTLPDNPYSFVPPQSLMAQFSAITREMLMLGTCEGYTLAHQYALTPSKCDWQAVSVQATADLARKLADQKLAEAVTRNLTVYHPHFLRTLMEACESVVLPAQVQSAFINVFDTYLSNDLPTALAALRGISCLAPSKEIQTALQRALATHNSVNIDLLSVIAARHFSQLDYSLLVLFFEQAALLDEKEQMKGKLFAGFFSDLVQLPALRADVLTLLRSPDRSNTLAKAIGLLFNQTRGQ